MAGLQHRWGVQCRAWEAAKVPSPPAAAPSGFLPPAPSSGLSRPHIPPMLLGPAKPVVHPPSFYIAGQYRGGHGGAGYGHWGHRKVIILVSNSMSLSVTCFDPSSPPPSSLHIPRAAPSLAPGRFPFPLHSETSFHFFPCLSNQS